MPPAYVANTLAIAADVLGRRVADLEPVFEDRSFLSLGGTSLRAAELVALAERNLKLTLDITSLLSDEPLACSLSTARPSAPLCVGPATAGGVRDASAAEAAMLLSEEWGTGRAFHLLFSADIYGELDDTRLLDAVQTLTHRHDSLRTVFAWEDGVPQARVIARWTAREIRQRIDLAPGDAGIWAIHGSLATTSERLLKPLSQPPVVFVLTRAGVDRRVLSILAHHVVADGWSIGLIWREIFALYAGDGALDLAPPAGTLTTLARPAPADETLESRIRELSGVPQSVRFPSDVPRPEVFDRVGCRLPVELAADDRAACELVAAGCGLTRNMVLFAAWTLAVARQTGSTDMLTGLSWAGRTTEDGRNTVGLGTNVLPVRSVLRPKDSLRTFVARTGEEVRRALGARAVPFDRLVAGLAASGDLQRNPLVQVVFAAHDELIPHRIETSDLTVDIHEGHCGGTAFDAVMYVQRWDERPRLALEFAPSVLAPHDAARLIESFRGIIRALANSLDAQISEISWKALEREMVELGSGPTVDAEVGLWQLIAQRAQLHLDEPAVLVAGRPPITYRMLLGAVEAQSARLHNAGVIAGDQVIIDMRRSAEEIVAVLAVLRLGAAYVPVDVWGSTEPARYLVEQIRPRAVVTDIQRIGELSYLAADVPALVVENPWDPTAGMIVPEPAVEDPSRVAYVAFTSGTTSRPKGTRIPQRAVVRLVKDSAFLRSGASARFLRLAPLSFDAATLELFAPLAAGGAISVYPDFPITPRSIATFIVDHAVTGLWLTAGLFRLVADYHPEAFRDVRQLLTGGDVVPAPQVRRVLRQCPGLRVTNGYGPTENTTFTTVHHIDDPADAIDDLPIGRPIQGTQVLVADEYGCPVPYGAVGELYAGGAGLAIDYLADPAETERQFCVLADHRRYYRTGDLVRWSGAGHLHYLGRRDDQVKVRGFRIEPAGIAAVLRAAPGVRDAVVVASGDDAAERVLVAGIIATAHPGLVESVRAYALAHLPGYAIPSHWAVVDDLPVTENGKVDTRRLTALAKSDHGTAGGR